MGAELIHESYEGEPLVDASIVLPVYNERGHLHEDIDRITRRAGRLRVLLRDHRHRRRLHRRVREALPDGHEATSA